MTISILNPGYLNITDEHRNKVYFGGTQDWYENEWHQRAGCGPTCAANILSYLAKSRTDLKALYDYDSMSKENFARCMEEVYQFVTPGGMGLNRVEMFTDGVDRYAKTKGVTLTPHVFSVPGFLSRDRLPASDLASFVMTGLQSDCPVAFLNLTKGKVKNIQGWHWITITKAEISDGNITAFASDEGKEISFDLKLWYLSTRMQGGLVYFT